MANENVYALQVHRNEIIQRVIALALLFMVAPLLIGVALLLLATDGAPVLYRHRRIGLQGKEFYCFKFRTMKRDADAVLERHLASNADARREWSETRKLLDDPRVGTIGRFLRKTSLDEFPQLLNVIKGEMALVGPRPIVSAEISKYGQHFAHYCAVKPGMTGLWQVSGRSATTYKRRVELDVFYVENRSWRMDLKVLLMTIPVVLLGRGSA